MTTQEEINAMWDKYDMKQEQGVNLGKMPSWARIPSAELKEMPEYKALNDEDKLTFATDSYRTAY
jgi:hypothetical protein